MHTLLRTALLALLLAAGVSAQAAELTVSAAASLTNAFRALAPVYEAQHPGTKLRFNFGASGALLQQIAKGAPVDVFASADQETMDQAQAQNLIIAAERRDFVSNTLVVAVPTDAKAAPKALADLARPAITRVAIGLPASVPAGRYTKAALEQAGLWAAIEPKAISAQNVRQALDYVSRGEVDAAFVYATDAALMPDKVRIALRVPTTSPVRYPVAPVTASANGAEARRFVAFLLGPQAQGVLAAHGFGRP